MKQVFFFFALLACLQAKGQKGGESFASAVCECIQKISLEGKTAEAIEASIGQCMEGSLAANKKSLKKEGIVDWDKGATEEQVMALWQLVFSKCKETTDVTFGKMEQLNDALLSTSFVGRVGYIQDIELSSLMKKMGITKESIIDEMRKEEKWVDSLNFYVRMGNYAYIGNNKTQYEKVYVADENIIYTYNAFGDDVCSVQEAVDLDLSGKPDKPEIVELDTVVTIMNLPCKAIRMKWKMGQYDYYYHPSMLNANPELFKKHTSEGLAQFVALSKCLPLQIVKTVMGMKMIQTAIFIQSGDFDKRYLSIPPLVEDESLNIIKMPGIKMMRIKQ